MDAIATTLLALAPGAAVAAVPPALLLAIGPRPARNHTRLRTLATWALAAASLAGLFTGLVWWLQVLIRIGLAHEDVRTWPSAFAPTVLCMVVVGVVLYQLLLLGIGHAHSAEERAQPRASAPKSGPS